MINKFSHIILPSDGNRVFFGAANSGGGFYSVFKNILKPFDKRILIKGGPGTGKSTLMKNVFGLAKSRGLSPEMMLCSSDPDSLDGVLIDKLSLPMASRLSTTNPRSTINTSGSKRSLRHILAGTTFST